MARLRFVGDTDACTVFGATFFRNRWTATHGVEGEQLELLKLNPTFEYDGGDAADEAEAASVAVEDQDHGEGGEDHAEGDQGA
jgi:hypothetical protein